MGERDPVSLFAFSDGSADLLLLRWPTGRRYLETTVGPEQRARDRERSTGAALAHPDPEVGLPGAQVHGRLVIGDRQHCRVGTAMRTHQLDEAAPRHAVDR